MDRWLHPGGPGHHLELDGSRTIAWIRSPEVGAPAEHRRYTLERRERGAPPEELASGLEIVPNSLAASDSTLYWTEGGSPRSAIWR